MKKYLSGLITGVLISICITAVMAAVPSIKKAVFTDAISIEVDGVKQNIEVVSVVKEGEENARNFVSVADLGKALGADVQWDGSRNTVVIKKGGSMAVMPTQTVTNNIDVWISLDDLASNFGYGLMTKFEDGCLIIDIYESQYNTNGNNNKIMTINATKNDSVIGAKIENSRAYLNKADLIREGLIK